MLRVGFLGCGRIADLHARHYQNPDTNAQIFSVCDVDEDLAIKRALEWGVRSEKVFTSWRNAIEDPDIDAVEILLPTPLHEEVAVAAAHCRKHVHLQKPPANSLESFERIVAAVAKAGVVLQVCENFVHYPPIVEARRLIDEGAIGQPSMLRAAFIGGGGGGWEVGAKAWEWRENEAASGRGLATFDHGFHLFSTAHYLCGPATKVQGVIHQKDARHDCPATATLQHQNGAVSTITWALCSDLHFGTCQAKYYACDEWIEVAGSKGVILITRCSGSLRPQLPALLLIDSEGERTVDVKGGTDWGLGFEGACANFVAACHGGAEAPAPALGAVMATNVLAACCAFQTAAREGRAITLARDSEYGPAFLLSPHIAASSTTCTVHTAAGEAVGVSTKWGGGQAVGGGQYCSLLTRAGIVGCGIYSLEVADGFGFAFALAKGTPDAPLVEPADLLGATISATSAAARALGIRVGCTGAVALAAMLAGGKTQRTSGLNQQGAASSTTCTVHTAAGEAVGVSTKWGGGQAVGGGQYCSLLTRAGIVGCGIYSLEVADEFGFAFALAKGTPDAPLVEPADLLGATISATSAAARALGIRVGCTGAVALAAMLATDFDKEEHVARL